MEAAGVATTTDRLATIMSGRAAKDTLAAACALGRTKARRGLMRRLADAASCLEQRWWAIDCMVLHVCVMVHVDLCR